MSILFVQDNAINESIAICEAATYLKRTTGTDSAILLTDHSRYFRHRNFARSPQAIVLSVGFFNLAWAHKTVKKLRQDYPGIPIAAAGCHPSFYVDECRSLDVDLLIRGESEIALRGWAEARFDHNYSNSGIGTPATISTYAPFMRDLNECHVPDRSLYWDIYPFMAAFPFKRFITGRGCVFECSFCFNPLIKGDAALKTFYRRKTVDHVVKELATAKEQTPIRQIHFSDDLFSEDREWLSEFLPRYKKEINLPFSCNVIGAQMNTKLIELLAEAECTSVSFGVESGNEAIRTGLLNKPVKNNKIMEVALSLKKAGIRITTFNMMGLPGETAEEALSTINFSSELGASHIRVSRSVALPDSPFYKLQGTDNVHGPDLDSIYYLQYWLFKYPGLQKHLTKSPALANPIIQKLAFGVGHAVSGFGFKVPLVAGLKYFLAVGSPSKYNNYLPSII